MPLYKYYYWSKRAQYWVFVGFSEECRKIWAERGFCTARVKYTYTEATDV